VLGKGCQGILPAALRTSLVSHDCSKCTFNRPVAGIMLLGRFVRVLQYTVGMDSTLEINMRHLNNKS